MRKCLVWCGFVALCCGIAGPAGAGNLDENLVQVLEVTPPGQSVSTMVFLSDQVDISALNASLDRERATLQRRHEVVVRALQEKAQATQGALRDYLKALQYAGRIGSFEAYWINNSFRVEATSAELQLLAQRADVGTIYFNYPIEQIEPVGAAPGGAEGGRTPEPGLVAINAPQVWAMGITGTGVVVSTLDTGVATHPALQSRWRGLDPRYAGHGDWAFFDPVTHQTTPFDSGYHGTHTMGTVCGGAPGDQIGVAPGAQWINAAVIDRVSLLRTCTDAVLAFQWLIDPDGNPTTNWDVPTSCSNSWGIATGHNIPPWSNPCDSSFWSSIDACEAAGIVVLFSAGNEGPTPNSLRRPADRATDEYRNLAVAAVDGNQPYPWPIAGFSSRGPTYCTPDHTAAIKPEVAAPGVHVRSAAPGGGYQYLDGTSMASPHVNGVVALMRQACPDLSVHDVKQILYQTARDLGNPGNDNDYGYGMIDAYQAVLLAQGMCGPKPPKADDGSYETPVDTPVAVQLNATDHDGGPLPMVFIITDLPNQQLTDVGNGHVIVPADVPYTLVNNGNHVTYTPSGGFYGTDVFHFKANDGGTPPTGGDSNIATITVLVKYGPPVITTTTLPVGCVAHPYGPFQLKASQGQPPLTWSIVTGQYVETDVGSSQFAEVGTAKGWNGDDNTWSYTLPFAFPFFGQTYTSCWVCSNGFIDFASNSNQWINSDAELIANKRIAPCWDDLKTNQAGGDIFVDAAGDHVTFRWKAVTYSGNSPVNVSATLYPDGKIRFNYGSGNTGLTPTIGISGGDGTHYKLSTYNNATNLTNANSHDFTLPVPLPNGMTLSPSGVLSGTPTESGTFTPQFKVVDSFGRSDQKQIALTVNATCSFVLGDMNCDGVVNFGDIDPFVLALSGATGYYEQYPNCYYYNGDCNNDGTVDFADIDPFVALLTH